MTEDQIDRIVERWMDNLDRQLTKGLMTSEEYDQEVKELDKWAMDMERNYRARQYREW
ncbi:MAG: hypothetical protein ABFD50_21130 [Smithella sp.]|jgi:hypothetical protein